MPYTYNRLRFDQAQFTAMDRTAYVAATACMAFLELFSDYYADELITLDEILLWVDEALAEVINPLR